MPLRRHRSHSNQPMTEQRPDPDALLGVAQPRGGTRAQGQAEGVLRNVPGRRQDVCHAPRRPAGDAGRGRPGCRRSSRPTGAPRRRPFSRGSRSSQRRRSPTRTSSSPRWTWRRFSRASPSSSSSTSSRTRTPRARATRSAIRTWWSFWTPGSTSTPPSTFSISRAGPTPCARSPARPSTRRSPTRSSGWPTRSSLSISRPRPFASACARARSTWRAAPPRPPRISSRTRTSRRCASWRCASSPSMSTSACASSARWATFKTVWRSGERLLVAVGPSPSSTQLVRWTRRMAASQGASWIAVSVEALQTAGWGGAAPPREESVARPRAGSRGRGHARHGCRRGARPGRAPEQRHPDRRRQVAQPAVARRAPRAATWSTGCCGSAASIDIYVVPAERAAEKATTWLDWRPATRLARTRVRRGRRRPWPPSRSPAGSSSPIPGTSRWASFYLLAVIVLSLRVGPGPVFVAGVLSALVWDYLFIPPIFTFAIGRFEDGLMFGTYFVVALISGQLTARVRAQERNERMREDRATALFHLTQAISSARTLDDAVFAALRQADKLLRSQVRASPRRRQRVGPHAPFCGLIRDQREGAGRRRLGVAQPEEGGPVHRHPPLVRGLPPAARAGGRRPRRPRPQAAPEVVAHRSPSATWPRASPTSLRSWSSASSCAPPASARSSSPSPTSSTGPCSTACPTSSRRRLPS